MSKEVVKRVKSAEIELKDKLVGIQRVTKVTKGGRHFSFSAIVVVGNEKGVVGYGLGKANEVTDAITKGIDDAKKNLVKVSVLKELFLIHKKVNLVVQEFS
jgi:small subunit ribosomal protein S5